MKSEFLCLFLLIGAFELSNGHGMLLDPVNRASRWRYDDKAPINIDDHELVCGGVGNQWVVNGGKCGLCGDSYSAPTPRKNEIGGSEFGEGVIVKTYKQTGQLPIGAMITNNHRGYFTFNLCDLDQQSENENCFEQYPLKTVGGDIKYMLPSTSTGWFNTTLSVPSDLRCKHCVLQWTYTTGNSWGICEDGSGQLGCGPQETFRTCSDISIQ